MNDKLSGILILAVFIASQFFSAALAQSNGIIKEQEAHEIGMEAYVYLYPLVTMDVTRRIHTNFNLDDQPGMGPMNTLAHWRAFPGDKDRDVVRPNFDTLYSRGWIDLTKEPVILTAPDTGGRYYLLPLIDMWTDVFAVPGTRTSGTKASQWILIPPGWNGSLPEGMNHIEAPTPYVWLIGRTQTNGPKDYANVHKIQEGYTITPLSKWGKKQEVIKAVIDPSVDMTTDPLQQINGMSAEQFFAYGAELMKVHPPHITDWSQIARMKRIGFEPGKSFHLSEADPIVQAALKRVPEDALNAMKAKLPTMARMANGWSINTDTVGVYGNYYLKRAIVALVGLGANQPEDAIYPLALADDQGKSLMGGNKYVIHFNKAAFPPVNNFVSITMYDIEGFQVANELNRYAIGDRDELTFNKDGSVDIYIQPQNPGTEKESNWLPSPKSGALGITMRLYAPKAEALDGRWNPPAIRRVD